MLSQTSVRSPGSERQSCVKELRKIWECCSEEGVPLSTTEELDVTAYLYIMLDEHTSTQTIKSYTIAKQFKSIEEFEVAIGCGVEETRHTATFEVNDLEGTV
jgi:hypothetical protein